MHWTYEVYQTIDFVQSYNITYERSMYKKLRCNKDLDEYSALRLNVDLYNIV